MTQRIAVIDYGGGNLASAANALREAARRDSIAADIVVTADPTEIDHADRLVLPGQGAFADCMNGLRGQPALLAALKTAVHINRRPFLGICVGMQIMAQDGHEHRLTEGLGWVRGHVTRMDPPADHRLPHMGWNELEFTPGCHALLQRTEPGAHAYFVHSYALRDYDDADCLAHCHYGNKIPALIGRANFAGVQFHVEKSQEVGLRILGNFMRWFPV